MNAERLGRLIDEYAGRLELFAAQWVRQPEDAVQEAFIELARRESEPDNVAAWLHAVTRNRAISMARAAARRARHETGRAGMDHRLVASADGTIDGRTAARALEELPDEQREVVVARIWGGLGFDAIADVVGTSKSTVHRRYGQAIEHLRRRLGLTWLTNENSGTTRATTSRGC